MRRLLPIALVAVLFLHGAPVNAMTVPGGGGVVTVPSWVKVADSHVRIVNYRAVLRSTTGLSASVLRHTRAAIARYNALPLSVRRAGRLALGGMRPASNQGNLAACSAGSYVALLWWGIWWKMSECMTQAIIQLGTGASVTAGLVAGLATLIPGGQILAGAAGLVGAAVGTVVWVMDFHDSLNCDNQGVSVDIVFANLSYLGC